VSFDQERFYQFRKLYDYRNQIMNSVFQMERILREYFPENYDLAYQHWIPQIITAIEDDEKWLNRGVYNFEDTVRSISENDDSSGGITKVI